MPGRRPDESEIEGDGESKGDSGNQGIGLFRAPGEAVDQPPGDEHTRSHPNQDDQRVVDGDLFEHHPFFAHEKKNDEIAHTVGDELGGAGRKSGES